MEASGVRRSCEIEVSNAERSRSVSAATRTCSMSRGEIDPFDCQRRLVGKRAEQPMLIRAEQRPRAVAVESDNSNRTAPGMHRKEQPLCAWQCIGAAPGRLIVLPAPFGGRKIGLVQDVFRRIGRAHRNRPALGEQQDDVDLEHRGDLERRCPQADHRA